MIYIKPYLLYESHINEMMLTEICDELLGSLPIWKRSREIIDPTTTVIIDTTGEKTAEAHFDIKASTRRRIVILMDRYPISQKEKGTLAHELVHAIQWITNQEGDLMFITDVTRELEDFSDSPIWERLMYAIYLSCPQEIEAWQADNMYFRRGILNEMIPWMRDFDPISASEELINNPPLENQWEMESFDQLPSFWAEAYKDYNEIKEGSDITGLGNLSLEEFLSHYNDKFKIACDMLKI